MAITPGTRLGQYEIVAPLGAGGMGEVYRARDPRLDRDVAIKVLPAQLSADPAALARFEREALSVAKLSHPNILSIYEFARDAGTAFVVMELVDGETLRARLDGGALPARKAVAYAQQIARGIAAAHAHGIVHRDLKPDNVMVTRDDHVKVLDFGLAKPIEPTETDPTRGVAFATSAGTILGTFGYMAPEQIRAQTVDQRTDIFALGAVLYEMLSGVRAFTGETAADTMSAVLTKDPPELDAARLSIPSGLDRIVRRCLEKSPDLRFQSATDLAFAFETLSSALSSASASAASIATPALSAPRARVAWLPWTITAAAFVAAAGVWFGNRPPAPETHWNSFTRITEAAGEETSPSLSPDGSTVLYAVRVNTSWDIYSQRVGGRNATPVVNDPQRNESSPAYSPDGALMAFHETDEDGGIFVCGATGESVRRLTDIGFNPAWSPDGRFIAFATEAVNDPAGRMTDSTLYVVEMSGGKPRKVVEGDAVQPSWSPSGDRIVYWSNTSGQRDIYTVAAAGGARVAIIQDAAIDWSPVWSPDGRFIYFASDRGGAMNLWRIPATASTGGAADTVEPVTAGVQASSALPSFSKDGSKIAFRSRVSSVNPVAIPFDPATLKAGTPFLLDTRNNIRIPSGVSPDGKQIAYFSIGERQEDLFVGSPDGPMRRVTDDAARDRSPVFTPDGRSLVFYSTRGGQWDIWMIGVDGGNLRKIGGGLNGAVYPLVSPKGDEVIFSGAAGGVYRVALPGGSAVELPGTIDGGRVFQATSWSPDAKRLVGLLLSRSGLPSGVAAYDLATHTLTSVTTDRTNAALWLSNSRRIVYFTDENLTLAVLDTATGKRTVVDLRLPGPSANEIFAISPGNQMIYYGASRAEADIWIMERK